MFNLKKISIGVVIFFLSVFVVYASVTVASSRKSWYLPWLWTYSWFYDSQHNVWSSNLPDTRFSFISWTAAWNESIVLDSITGLYWQSEWITQWKMLHSESITYCDSLVLWWYSDWRLPNIQEMASLLDFSNQVNPFNSSFFTIDIRYWSSTIFKKNWTSHYYIDHAYWNIWSMTSDTTTNTMYTPRCVR